MSQIKTLNGVQYTLPQYNDTGWGANTGNVLTQYMAAIADVTLQLSGGSFTLTADVNFGATYGLVSAYFTSRTSTPATAGAIRLAKTDVISWRNNAAGGNIDLSKDTSDNLKWNATKILLSGAVVNADINAAAAIAYSKLALTGSIVNADISASAAIAYSKLTLTGSIVNADVNASAAIAYSKLNLATSIVNADINGSAAIAYSKLALATSIVNADISGSAAIAYSKLALTGAILNADLAGAVSIAKGGTNSVAALGNGRAMVSSSGAIVEGAATVNAAGYVIGTIVQAVQATNTGSTSSSGTSYTSTGTTASITPKSTTHKIKVTITGVLQNAQLVTNQSQASIFRGSTDLDATGQGFSQFNTNSGSGVFNIPCSMCFIDSPASTSALTYTVKILSTVSAKAVWNPNTGTCVITLEEIAQ